MKEANRQKDPTHCYLCGHSLPDLTSKDHCPPRALFARKILKQNNLDRLVTKQVHMDCNQSYMRDEEYFVATLVPFAQGSEAGDAIYREFFEKSRKDKKKWKLAKKILRQFEPRPSGLHLPEGRVIMRQEGDRVSRVAWKIVRGLYFHHHNTTLPEDINFSCKEATQGERPPELFMYVRNLPDDKTHGRYPGIFDYRFRVLEANSRKLHHWALLIWDRIILTVDFHDPWSCKCENCVSALRIWNQRALQPRIPNRARSSRYV